MILSNNSLDNIFGTKFAPIPSILCLPVLFCESKGEEYGSTAIISVFIASFFNLFAIPEIVPPLPTQAINTSIFLTLHDPMNYSMPGSFVHGILQARILEWVAMHSSRGSSCPTD